MDVETDISSIQLAIGLQLQRHVYSMHVSFMTA